jgi:fructan beta-fructosidase
MHWGHAVSRDLMRWEHLPVALAPDEQGYIFSGSAVVDWKNTSGLGDGETPPLVAIFTYHDMAKEKAGVDDEESQAIAFSNDRGRTWTKFAGNPVLPNPGGVNDFRDPKVFWHEASSRWVMALAMGDEIGFFASPDLKSWSSLSRFGKGTGAHGGVWECPDLFPLAVAETGETKWVLLVSLNPGGPQGGSATQYFIGEFDGTSFVPDADLQTPQWIDWGRDNYAGVTVSDAPGGRRIFIGWMSNWDYATKVPTNPWRSAMTLPRELSLHRTGDGLRLRSAPVAEFDRLKSAPALRSVTAAGETALDLPAALPAQGEIALSFARPADGAVALVLTNDAGETYSLAYDAAADAFVSDRTKAGPSRFSDKFARVHRAPRLSASPTVTMRVVFDRASAELFADEGEVTMTETYFPSAAFSAASVIREGAAIDIRVEAAPAARVWP